MNSFYTLYILCCSLLLFLSLILPTSCDFTTTLFQFNVQKYKKNLKNTHFYAKNCKKTAKRVKFYDFYSIFTLFENKF